MTTPHPGPPRDVYLPAWLDGVAHHAPPDRRAVLAHQAVRTLIGELGAALHAILPPGREKVMVYTALEDALMRGNRAIAITGGPNETCTEDLLLAACRAPLTGNENDRAVDVGTPTWPQGSGPGGCHMPGDHAPGEEPPTPDDGAVDRLSDDRLAYSDRARGVEEVLRSALSGDYEISAEGYRRASYAVLAAGLVDASGMWHLPDDARREDAVFVLDAINAEVHRRWPGYAWAPSVTPAEEAGGIAEVEPRNPADPFTIWGLEDGIQDVALGVTALDGAVGIAVDRRDGGRGNALEAVLHTIDAVNRFLETVSAAAGQSFNQR